MDNSARTIIRPLTHQQHNHIRYDYRLQQNRRTFTNYKKADWTQFTEDTESAFAQTTIPTNIHTANRIVTNILMADKHNIPKGNMHSNCRLLPDYIVCKITQRNNIRRANTCDPALKLLNEEITSDIQKHKQNMVPKISAYSWWNCQATHNRLQIEINYYPDSLLFVSAGFLPRVSSQRLN